MRIQTFFMIVVPAIAILMMVFAVMSSPSIDAYHAADSRCIHAVYARAFGLCAVAETVLCIVASIFSLLASADSSAEAERAWKSVDRMQAVLDRLQIHKPEEPEDAE